MWRAVQRAFRLTSPVARDRLPREMLESRDSDWFESHMLSAGAQPPASTDLLSVASNPSVSSYNSSSRRRAHQYIAMQYFGPSSRSDFEDSSNRAHVSALEASASSSADERWRHDSASRTTPSETCDQRRERKENERAFEDLVHLANTRQPVALNTFKRKSTSQRPQPTGRLNSSSLGHESNVTTSAPHGTQLNTDLIEAYVAYARAIGHEPEIEVAVGDPLSGDESEALAAERLSYLHERKRVGDREHWATQWIGTRFSRRRGCVQFWSFLLLGVVVTTVMIASLAQVRLNEVLHLDAFVGSDVTITDDFAFMHFRDEVGLRLKYDIEAVDQEFQVLLLTEQNFDRFVTGENFSIVTDGSCFRTKYASLPLTRFENPGHDEMYLVIQPCRLARVPTLDFCQGGHLPAVVSSKQKLFALRRRGDAKQDAAGLWLRSYYVNPMPDHCSASGWKGTPFLLIFVPYVLASLFGLRVVQMTFRCESFRANLERNYKNEFAIPDEEVDYWQPTPWDRKVPKTRLLGPCCWKKMRRPLEPFYTWWRHENYFTWIFFPYRNERLSRGERGIIVFCSLYITFYVTFVLSMLHSSFRDDFFVLGSVVIYWLLLLVLPSLGKAIFKEIFKLIFRQRRKYFRLKAAGGDTSGFSFRVAFLLQVLVVLFISVAQGPMLYIWLNRSCTFLAEFMFFGVLAAVARLSLVGLVMDFIWYAVISTWGWRDLCPHCTERLAACDCFNDELLVLSVERVGAKWDLILLLDATLSRHAGHEPQFAHYTADQLGERWLVLVDRATAHLERVEKLRVYRLKKRRDALRRRNKTRLSRLVERASFLRQEDVVEGHVDETEDDLEEVDSLRERKIIALNRKLNSGKPMSRGRSRLVDVVDSMQHAIQTDQAGMANHLAPTRRAGAIGNSMFIAFTTSAQRLARREDERERRERVFSVLRRYRIEKQTVRTEKEDTRPSLKQVARPRGWWCSLRDRLDHSREVFVPAPFENPHDLVEVVIDDTLLESVVEDNDGVAEEPPQSFGAENEAPPPTSRTQVQTFEVTERQPALWERAVDQAGSVVGWLFKYDSSQY